SGAVRPVDLLEFSRLVSPELRRRGVLEPAENDGVSAADARPLTIRERVTGKGPRLAEDHRGAQYRALGGKPRG
ncbi:MAG TPA: hypothetical protein VHH13_05160, partial [Arthrobacter sp.]|nr:hypothetical protein [Arthrobacter sp.]